MKQFITLCLSCCAILVVSGCVIMPPPDAVVCGGLAGQACPDDQYCAYPQGADCGRADATGICEPKPEVCTEEYMPVCGCNGETYDNACMAALAGISLDYPGDCGGEQLVCGGIGRLLCPEGLQCVDNPGDDCDPARGDADCMGICK